jgi:hypothetical protein
LVTTKLAVVETKLVRLVQFTKFVLISNPNVPPLLADTARSNCPPGNAVMEPTLGALGTTVSMALLLTGAEASFETTTE